MDTTNKGVDPAEYLKKIFNCPEDDWGAVKFGRIKEKFINLINQEDAEGILLELAKAYANDATRSFMLDEMKDYSGNMESMMELGNIASMGFILMGVYYGYLLKQKELREKPVMLDWSWLDNLKDTRKEGLKEKKEGDDMK